MSNVTKLHETDIDPMVNHVAGVARGLLAQNKIPSYKLNVLLNMDVSTGYWQRRTSGDIPMDVSDLNLLASLLRVPITRFFEGAPQLPRLDSNQQPFGKQPNSQTGNVTHVTFGTLTGSGNNSTDAEVVQLFG